VADSASGETRAELSDTNFVLRDRLPIRTFFRLEYRLPGGGVRILGSAISEHGEPVRLPIGSPASISFRALAPGGGEPIEVLAYVDRIRRSLESSGLKHSIAELPPGEHVLVLNQPGTRARHELKFTLGSGETLDLGTLPLE
jgi:hypothetical protein